MVRRGVRGKGSMKFPVLQLTFPFASGIRFSLRCGYFDKSGAAQSVFHLYAIKEKEKRSVSISE